MLNSEPGLRKFWAAALVTASVATLAAAPLVQAFEAPNEAKLKTILAEFQKYAADAMQQWQVPGMAIAIVKDDEIIYANGFGVRCVTELQPVDTGTLFQIGSTTKAFTAALVAMLVDEGEVNWDDRVIDHLPDFAMYDPWVTREFRVRDLMAQRSGMVAYAGDMQGQLGFDREHIIRSLRHLRPASSFRSEFAYVNNLFLVAGKLVESKTGKSWEQNIQQRLLDPLGMSSSSLDMSAYTSSRNFAIPYSFNDQVHRNSLDASFDCYVFGPAGGINSNVIEMTRWIRLHLNAGSANGSQLVSRQNMEFMHSPHTIVGMYAGAQLYYCQGWIYHDIKPHPLVFHTGGTAGCSAVVALVAEENLGIVILCNSSRGLPQYLALQFLDMYYGRAGTDRCAEALEAQAALAEAESPQRPHTPQPPLPLEAYAGTYTQDIYGTATVSMDGEGGLNVVMGPAKLPLSLAHFDGNIFLAERTDINTSAGFVEFRINDQQQAVSMSFVILNQGCEYPFIRQQQ